MIFLGRSVRQLGSVRRSTPNSFRLLTICILSVVPPIGSVIADERASKLEFFETRIRPVLAKHCYECHSAGSSKIEGGLQLDFREGLRKGGDSGPGLVPELPEQSRILEALRYDTLQMPPSGKLSEEVVRDFESWIQSGALDPRDQPVAAADASAEAWKGHLAERSAWWSLQPLKPSEPPSVADPIWQREPIDRFIRAATLASGLSHAPQATPEVLLRRLSIVLTGLPPRPEEVFEFQESYRLDPDGAYAEWVDRLLESPHFGERFARHWMDVMHYTDTYGYEWDIAAKGSWEYRDYLIRAFNSDVGFDQLIREQIAGDLLPQPRRNESEGINESLIGPMFFHFGERRHGSSIDFAGVHQEMADSQIDAFSKSFLAMTVACARCHDHKLDAISQRDYYALAGVFMTPRWTSRSIDTLDKYATPIEKLQQLRDEIQRRLGEVWQRKLRESSWDWRVLAEKSKSDTSFDALGYPLTVLFRERTAPPAEQINATEEGGTILVERWGELTQQWHKERDRRREHNRAFTLLTDFPTPQLPEEWVIDGPGMAHGWVAEGTPRIALEGDTLVAELLPRGMHTHALSPKLSGALRLTEAHRFPKSHLSIRTGGGEWAGVRHIPQNAFLNEGPTFFNPASGPDWTTFTATALKHGVTRILSEISTPDLNANFPPRTGVARMGSLKLPNEDNGYDKRGWFSVTRIVAHDKPGRPLDELDIYADLFSMSAPNNDASIQQALLDWYRRVLDRWVAKQSNPGDSQLLNWLVQRGVLNTDADELLELGELVAKYREIESTIGFPRSVNSMDERGVQPVDYRLNVRGDVHNEGPAIRRNFLEVFAGKHNVGDSASSGRLELANYLSSSENPQTSRVYVNRVWQWIFGTGIVDTPSDFGKLGGRPSHPELLDWLSLHFIEDGWSTKRLVRRLVLSETFRQSGQVAAHNREVDPGNRLLHHYPTRRLEAEAIRDSLLAVSGRLDRSLYGRPIRPHRSAVDAQKRLFSGPRDGDGRRSIYLEMSVMQPPEFLVGFNLPDLKIPTGRRDVTNVPAQALLLMNSHFVTEMSERWGTRLVSESDQDLEERISNMFLTALGRVPTQSELQSWLKAARAFSDSEQSIAIDPQVWSRLAHALFNTKEFLYYR